MTATEPLTLEEAQKRFPPMWTVYDHPRDQPDHFVVRLFYGEVWTPEGYLFHTLAQARIWIQSIGGCVRIPRSPDDDPVIVETWL